MSALDGDGHTVRFESYDPLGALTQWFTYPGTQNGSPSQEVFSLTPDEIQRPRTLMQPDNRTFQWSYVNHVNGAPTRNLDHTIDEAGTQVNFSFCPVCDALEAISSGTWGLSWQDDGDG